VVAIAVSRSPKSTFSEHRHRLVVLGLQRAQRVRVFKEGAPIEQLGQMIGAANQKGTPRRAFCNVQNVRD